MAALREHTSWRGYDGGKKIMYANSHNPWGGNKICICVR